MTLDRFQKFHSPIDPIRNYNELNHHYTLDWNALNNDNKIQFDLFNKFLEYPDINLEGVSDVKYHG